MKNIKNALLAAYAITLISFSTNLQAGEILDNIAKTKEIRIGYRLDAPPFSYKLQNGEVIGYTIDLCKHIINDIKQHLNIDTINIKYIPVTSTERIPAIINNKIDIECSETTNTVERRKQVAFGLAHFYSGVQMLTYKNKQKNEINKIAVIKDSTSEDIFKLSNSKLPANSEVIFVNSHDEALEKLERNNVDAALYDDILLIPLTKKSAKPLELIGNKMSIEPLSIIYSKEDKELNRLIHSKMRDLYKSSAMHSLYKKWFQNILPEKGYNLDININPLLADIFRRPSGYVTDWVIL